MEEKISKKELNKYMYTYVFLTLGLFLATYENKLDSYNSSIMALNYKYGFISRGLLGTVYAALNKLLPIDLINYSAALSFTLLVTVCFFAFLLLIARSILLKTNRKNRVVTAYLLLILIVILVPSFSAERNFGRVDLYMIGLSILGAYLLIVKKCEWLIIPIAALGVMVHQAYVFMYFNILLVLLCYRLLDAICESQKKQIIYYALILAISFVTASVLFLWFNFFSHANGENIVDEIIRNASALSLNGEYHKTLIGHEVLGIDPSEEEWGYHLMNFIEFPFLLLFFLPYVIWTARIFRRSMSKEHCQSLSLPQAQVDFRDKCRTLKYLLAGLGAFTILPNLILKCDYGRWMLSVAIYYVMILISLLAMGDEKITVAANGVVEEIKKKYHWIELFLIYPVLFLPVWDVNITKITASIASELNNLFLHWW